MHIRVWNNNKFWMGKLTKKKWGNFSRSSPFKGINGIVSKIIFSEFVYKSHFFGTAIEWPKLKHLAFFFSLLPFSFRLFVVSSFYLFLFPVQFQFSFIFSFVHSSFSRLSGFDLWTLIMIANTMIKELQIGYCCLNKSVNISCGHYWKLCK